MFAGAQGRCPACGSPRVVAHDELHRLSVAHIDCDAFYATVEKRDDPALRDKAVLVGGSRRGVVMACCYVARMSGIHSAMPMFKALRACPDAVVIKPNLAKYRAVSAEVRARMEAVTPLVQPLSLDEAFLDLSGTERLHKASPAATLARLAAAIEAEVGVTVSVGLSHNKFLAKIASDLDKPRGFAVIGAAETRGFLAEKPVGLLWGVGARTRAKLRRDGIERIGQLQAIPEAELMRRYGSFGAQLARYARGEDSRKVRPGLGAKSISSETTFATDISDADALAARLWPLCEKVARRLKRKGIAGRTATLKLKTARFRTLTRSRSLSSPTQLADRLFRNVLPLLQKEADGTAYRLIGVGLSELCDGEDADPPDLADPNATRRAAVERAVDSLRDRFGDAAIGTGRGLKRG